MKPPSLGRLLIVDDETELVTVLCRLFETQGYAVVGVTSAADADRALAAASAASTPFDILMTDLMMPGTDGIALLSSALALDAALAVIVMTGHGTIATAVAAMKSGALDYILKPFKLSVALPVVTRALAVRGLRLENASLTRQLARHSAELKESNRQLSMANTDLDAYNASVSHDIRGQLNSIIGFSRMLSDGLAGPLNGKQKQFAEFAYRGGLQLMRLTDGLLQFSRLGQNPIAKHRVCISSLVGGLFEDLTPAAAGPGVVDLRMEPLPDAFADPLLIQQVFRNLLSNAIKFSAGQSCPTVTVEGQSSAGQCRYTVRDNGIGFDMDHAAGLFGIFQRLPGSQGFEGTGVGLSIARSIVQRHGGQISVHARPGLGAAFTFTLPLPASERASRNPSACPPDSPAFGHSAIV